MEAIKRYSMLCLLGCLDTKNGKIICKEMREWLDKEHKVLEVHQDPPGKLFEYPFLNYAIKLSLDTMQPVLYLHTKGAGNTIPPWYDKYIITKDINVPQGATIYDAQKTVRNMWKHEFTGDRLKVYLNAVNTDIPLVACPLTGKEKVTWQNGFIMNYAAAKELSKTFHLDSNRYYYENMFCNTNITVKGMIAEDCDRENKKYWKNMWNYIWKFYC